MLYNVLTVLNETSGGLSYFLYDETATVAPHVRAMCRQRFVQVDGMLPMDCCTRGDKDRALFPKSFFFVFFVGMVKRG